MASTTQAERRRRYRRGRHGELLALASFLLKGYRPLAWRYKTPVGEIDLVLTRAGRLLFVEVKGRATHDSAAHAIDARTRSRVVRAAQYYLASHPTLAGREIRFDVCLVAWYHWPRTIPNAFM